MVQQVLKQVLKLLKLILAELPREKWFDIRLKDDEVNQQLEAAIKTIEAISVKNMRKTFE